MLVTLGEEGTLQQRVYSGLRHAILEGRLRAGSRLPSTRLLARDLGVSRNTALLAYEQLLGEGYVVARAGSGTYVAPQLPDAMLSAREAGAAAPARPAAAPRLSAYARRALAADPLSVPGARSGGAPLRYDFRYGNLSVGEFPHETWRRLVARRARRLTPRSLAYAAPHGHGPLREAIAAYLRRARAVACRPEQVVVVDGSQQGLDLVARALLDPGDLVVVEDPQYQGARKVFAAAGARIATVAVDAEGADVSALLADGREARLAYVTPSHQFPTGATMSLARRLALLAWAERAGAYVVEDDYDSEFRYEGRPVEAVQGLDRHGRVIYLGTFSKVLFPALRIGYVVLPDPLVEPFVAAKWLADRQTATFEQEVLADFIGEGHFERHLRRTRASNAARRAALLGALRDRVGDRVRVEGANAGVHLLAWLAGVPAAEAERVAARAAEVGVGVYPIAPYYVAPPPEAGLLLGYAALSEREIREGIRRLAGVVPRG
jgi:GntR family transcriptional regulator / MocR family aminotransferase